MKVLFPCILSLRQDQSTCELETNVVFIIEGRNSRRTYSCALAIASKMKMIRYIAPAYLYVGHITHHT